MKNTFGQNLTVTLYGESHGRAIGAVIDGIAPGIPVDEEYITHWLNLRKPHGAISTARQEADEFSIDSGVFNGYTTGTPVAIRIENRSQISKDYSYLATAARPGHADYAAYCKYHGYADYRGGGHFSGRVTAAFCAAGAIVLSALKAKRIRIGTHIKRLGKVCDSAFGNYAEDIERLEQRVFPVLNTAIEEEMQAEILAAKERLDSVGGILETVILGMPGGVGEPYFDSLESLLAHAMFSIGGVKGVEFGDGFAMADRLGSEANDAFRVKDGEVVTVTNHNGGINGGISNGMPILFRCAVKPTPSIAQKQQTVDFVSKKNKELEIHGRHDPAIVHRARAVVDCLTALTVADALVGRFGTDWLAPKEEER
ncbi:MAG: chorismate synthase [Clostridia bacterium]|nr:chorismate synthase [Clostridia bacterium]